VFIMYSNLEINSFPKIADLDDNKEHFKNYRRFQEAVSSLAFQYGDECAEYLRQKIERSASAAINGMVDQLPKLTQNEFNKKLKEKFISTLEEIESEKWPVSSFKEIKLSDFDEEIGIEFKKTLGELKNKNFSHFPLSDNCALLYRMYEIKQYFIFHRMKNVSNQSQETMEKIADKVAEFLPSFMAQQPPTHEQVIQLAQSFIAQNPPN